jgi:hypothetical protein
MFIGVLWWDARMIKRKFELCLTVLRGIREKRQQKGYLAE